MPTCPNCDTVEMISSHSHAVVRGAASDQVGPRSCPSCGYGE